MGMAPLLERHPFYVHTLASPADAQASVVMQSHPLIYVKLFKDARQAVTRQS